MLIPFDQALRSLGLSDIYRVLPVGSGYPSPKTINLVLRKLGGTALLFESSAATDSIVEQVTQALGDADVQRLDAMLVTHCHGDHAGSAGIIAGLGRSNDERAPIYLHSAGYRFLTHPEAAFLNETYELYLTRAHWGLLDYSAISDQEMIHNALRGRFRRYFAQTPKGALRFVDRAELPNGIAAVFTPGHSHDCVLYYDEALGVVVPGDTIICTGHPDQPETHAFVIPIFTAAGQSYSMAFERYVHTIAVLRRFFETRHVRAILPPHGKFAVTEPLSWVRFAESYFNEIYRALREDFLGDPERANKPFLAKDLSAFIPSAGSHRVSTPGHVFGMLCALADEGYLRLTEHVVTRNIAFEVLTMPPSDFMAQRLARDPGPLAVYHHGQYPIGA